MSEQPSLADLLAELRLHTRVLRSIRTTADLALLLVIGCLTFAACRWLLAF